MKYIKKYNEISSYLNLHGDDDYEITQVKSDNNHEYKRLDGVLYELSGKDDRIVYVEDIEATPENTFYEDQIERYIEYIENDGILQTFPVCESKKCSNLKDMIDFLDDSDNFDITYDLLKKHHEKLFNVFMSDGLYTLYMYPEDYGFIEPNLELTEISDIKDLHEYYNEESENFDEEILNGLIAIIEYFEDEIEYTLLDFNHRFEALKRLGKSRVYVEVMD